MKKCIGLVLAVVLVFGIYLSIPINSNAAQLPEVQVTSVSSTSKGVKIEWEQLNNIEGYIVFKLVQNEAGEYVYQQLAVVGASTLAFTDRTAVDGETYCYAVAAMDAMGNAGQYSEFAHTYKKLTTLSTPKVSVKGTSSGVKVSWKAIENAETYTIYRRTYNTKTKKYSSWTTLNKDYTKISYTDKKVNLGKTYSYKVKAVNGDVKSTSAATKNIKFNVVPTVEIANAQKGISVKWSKIPSATGYIVYSATYNSKTKKWSGWTNRETTKSTTTSWTDKKVKNGSIYRYTVRAVYSGGKTGYKATGALRFLTQPTVKIANASNGVKVSWNKNTSATGYTVYRATLTNGKWSSWKNVKTTKNNVFSFVDKNAGSGEVYRYTVKATNANSKSSYKATEKIMFLSQPQVTVATSSNGVKVNWTETTGAIKYAIYRSEYVDGKWTSWFNISTTPNLSLTDTNALKGVKYKYAARAINGNFKSTYKASSAINGCVTPGSQGGSTSTTPRPDVTYYIPTTVPVQPTEYVPDTTYSSYIPTTRPVNIWDKETIFNFYKKSAHDIATNGSAGYNKLEYQVVPVVNFGSCASIFSPILESYLITEDEAEVKVNQKGSYDAMCRFPDCTLTDLSKVKSATKRDLPNGNYRITIVMMDEDTPMNKETSFLSQVTNSVFYWDDIQEVINEYSFIKSINSKSVLHESFTIEAEMTRDGKFVSLTHYATVDMYANVDILVVGNQDIECEILNACEYFNFIY
ncbi:MAG: hypothetical protein E7556_00430 [Ruminococcaceae bacterium]|nr:hypothetical protein [Oscillospiraceae bacterium]